MWPSVVFQEVALYVAGGLHAAHTGEGDLVPAVTGAARDLDRGAVGHGGQSLIIRAGSGTHIYTVSAVDDHRGACVQGAAGRGARAGARAGARTGRGGQGAAEAAPDDAHGLLAAVSD